MVSGSMLASRQLFHFFFLFVSLAQTTPAQPAWGTSPSVGLLVLVARRWVIRHGMMHPAVGTAVGTVVGTADGTRKRSKKIERTEWIHSRIVILSSCAYCDIDRRGRQMRR